jgi:hypothetical protein
MSSLLKRGRSSYIQEEDEDDPSVDARPDRHRSSKKPRSQQHPPEKDQSRLGWPRLNPPDSVTGDLARTITRDRDPNKSLANVPVARDEMMRCGAGMFVMFLPSGYLEPSRSGAPSEVFPLHSHRRL